MRQSHRGEAAFWCVSMHCTAPRTRSTWSMGMMLPCGYEIDRIDQMSHKLHYSTVPIF